VRHKANDGTGLIYDTWASFKYCGLAYPVQQCSIYTVVTTDVQSWIRCPILYVHASITQSANAEEACTATCWCRPTADARVRCCCCCCGCCLLRRPASRRNSLWLSSFMSGTSLSSLFFLPRRKKKRAAKFRPVENFFPEKTVL